jgi:thiol-disulfide isomerase/thioredoxin
MSKPSGAERSVSGSPAGAGRRLLVACLCAAWCGSCREYRATFDALGDGFGGEADFVWVDVEDEADALGDLDIEDFPTLLIADADTILFLGPVTPQAQTAERLVRSALAGELEVVESEHPDLPAQVRGLGARSSPDRDGTA